MAVVLTPRIYGQSAKLKLQNSNNTFTSVKIPVMDNTTSDPTVIHTESFTTVNVDGADVTLPIDRSTQPTYYRFSYNTRNVPVLLPDFTFAKARTECVMAEGTRTFTIDKEIEGMPTVQFRLRGKSYMIERSISTFDDYPTLTQLQSRNFNLASWIHGNRTSSSDSLYDDYTSKINLTPWINKPVAIPSVAQYEDVRTSWVNMNDESEYRPLRADWRDQGNIAPSSYVGIYPPGMVADLDAHYRSLYVGNVVVYPYVHVTQNNDTTFTIDWKIPVRYAYAAASRGRNFLGTTNEVDNFAYLDEITQIDIDLVASQRNTDFSNYTFVVNEKGTFDVGTSENCLVLGESESTTKNSTYKELPLAEIIPFLIVSPNRTSKYVLECDVPVSWVIQNDLRIGSNFPFRLQNGELLQRYLSDFPVYFSIQNMVLKYDSNKFIYTLHLMEV